MAAAQTMPTLFEVPAAATPAAAEAQAAPVPTPSSVASENSLFELDAELDFLLEQIEDEIEEHGEATPESMKRMQLFCQAMSVDERQGGPHRALHHHDGVPRRALPEAGQPIRAACGPRTEQDRSHEEDGSRIPRHP